MKSVGKCFGSERFFGLVVARGSRIAPPQRGETFLDFSPVKRYKYAETSMFPPIDKRMIGKKGYRFQCEDFLPLRRY